MGHRMTFRLVASGGARKRLVESRAQEPREGEVRDEHSAALQEELSGPWPAASRRSGYRETAFRAAAQSLAMGAALLAVVHVAGTVAQAAGGTVGSVPVWPPSRGGGGQTATAAGEGSWLVDLAATEQRLVIPPVRLPMVEAGVYFTYADAKRAVAAFSASGVTTTVAGAARPYTLLVAPYYGAKARVQATERLLARAEVPYFVRPWTAGAYAVALPRTMASRAGALERFFVADEQVLWWLVGGAGSAANGSALWAASRKAAQAARVGTVLPALGVLGVKLRKFDAAVGRAWVERDAEAAGQTAQTQALADLAALR